DLRRTVPEGLRPLGRIEDQIKSAECVVLKRRGGPGNGDHAGRSSWRLRRTRRDLSRVSHRKVSQQIRQPDRKPAKPCILFEQPQKVASLLTGRTISPQSVGFFKQWRQRG